jgi:riboflavin synthase
MFTGIVEELGRVRELKRLRGTFWLTIGATEAIKETKIGDSIAVNGVCLTVVDLQQDLLSFEVVEETLSRTNLSQIRRGDRVNLERAVKVGNFFGGHFVTGHIDGTGVIKSKGKNSSGDIQIEISARESIMQFVIDKGSIAVDGVSLTVAKSSASDFAVVLIPHTLGTSTLGFRDVGDKVNLETVLIGKYVYKFIKEKISSEQVITKEFLEKHGFS